MKFVNRIGVLIVNLGTPDSHQPTDVKKYLIEFLTDERVIDLPWFKRQVLVRGVIVPKRYKESAKNYARIWTEKGSPLKVYGELVKNLLQVSLGERFQVELAMRYQSPSIEMGLNRLKGCSELVIIPLFPQYASATTGSIHQKVMKVISGWKTIPEMHFVNSYPVQNQMIEAFCQRSKEFDLQNYDHVVLSFHGLPEKHIRNSDEHQSCLKIDCCKSLCDKNKLCYSAQCYATAYAIAKSLNLSKDKLTISFQSRLGKDPWLKPYTSDTLKSLLENGIKKVLVFCPAFVCDCLETLDEIGNEYRQEFLNHGGEILDLVPGINEHPLWIEALKSIVLEQVEKQVLCQSKKVHDTTYEYTPQTKIT